MSNSIIFYRWDLTAGINFRVQFEERRPSIFPWNGHLAMYIWQNNCFCCCCCSTGCMAMKHNTTSTPIDSLFSSLFFLSVDGTLARSSGWRRRRSCCCPRMSTVPTWSVTRSPGATTIPCRCGTGTPSSTTGSGSWMKAGSSSRGEQPSEHCRSWSSTTAETRTDSALT